MLHLAQLQVEDMIGLDASCDEVAPPVHSDQSSPYQGKGTRKKVFFLWKVH